MLDAVPCALRPDPSCQPKSPPPGHIPSPSGITSHVLRIQLTAPPVCRRELLPRSVFMPNFVTDVEEIRRRAAEKIEEGAVTATYEGDVEQTISILNEALATEIVCVLRYMHHYFMATGVHGVAVRDEFKEHADAEREHADKIADRIQQLGGRPDYNPATLIQRSASQYAEGNSLADMIREDLIAERIVIEVYQKMIRHFADDDPTTRILFEDILKDEEEHASDLSDLLFI